jgi:aminoglycoside phosphotransferase (APT) family kinase protein
VIDWEIWSVGDPRLDLAWFCMMMDRGHPGVTIDRANLPTQNDMVGWYQETSGAAVADLPWFLALASYKQSATSALISKNALKRNQFGAADRRRVDLAGALLRWTLDLLG